MTSEEISILIITILLVLVITTNYAWFLVNNDLNKKISELQENLDGWDDLTDEWWSVYMMHVQRDVRPELAAREADAAINLLKKSNKK